MFNPVFSFTADITNHLLKIESSRVAIQSLPINIKLLSSLRESARLDSTHYSTQIEGNRLSPSEVEQVVKGHKSYGRERDEQEVKNYYKALDFLDTAIISSETEITEKNIQTIHGLVMQGKERPTAYRDGQNVIRNSLDGKIIYMPPEHFDVPKLMAELCDWINKEISQKSLPIPVVAAIAHYQFATIHPYYDGNGRTARLLTSLILHLNDYGLKGIYALEEYYAKNLQGYYNALSIGDSHNYYLGRAKADITQWLVYFCEAMAISFSGIHHKILDLNSGGEDHSHLLRKLDSRQKQVLMLFQESQYIATKEIAHQLGITPRAALNLCKKWTEEGFIIETSHSKKTRKYELAEKWLILIE